MLVAGVAERPPSEREVAIEIYVVSVLPGACGDTVGIEIADDPDRRSSWRWPGGEPICDSNLRRFVAVDASNDEHWAGGVGIAEHNRTDRSAAH